MARSAGEIPSASRNALSKFLDQDGLAMDVKNAVAENIPAFCKNLRRLVPGMMISFHKSSKVSRNERKGAAIAKKVQCCAVASLRALREIKS